MRRHCLLFVNIRVVNHLTISAGLVVSVVKPQPGDRILDACAAPGGKTLFMASCLKRQGNLTKAHCSNIHLFCYFDSILILKLANSR